MECPVCKNAMTTLFHGTLLGKHNVAYFRCPNCQLIKTEDPWWLDEAYSDAIAITDTGLADRNLKNAKLLEPMIYRLASDNAKIVDVGGGYGLLTRLLRDKGFDCYSYDKYCKNIFSPLFEADDHCNADILLAFELMEHIPDPLATLTEYFSRFARHKNMVFSTRIYREKAPPQSWWYYSFETGQHITFYSPKTLAILAEKLGVHYIKLNNELHLFLEQKPSVPTRKLLGSKKLKQAYAGYVRFRRKGQSKTWSDHLLAKATLSGHVE